jgi:hypothetical protein
MKHIQNTTAVALLLSLFFTASAQGDTASSKPQFKLSANYNTRLNYYGRTDQSKSSAFFPLAELWLSSKFYVNAAPVFVNNRFKQFDYAGTAATAGYQNVGNKWISSFYVTRPFYKPNSAPVQSALKAQSGLSLTHRNNFLNVTAGGDLKLSDKLDYGASAGLDHVVRIENRNKSAVIFDPAVYVYAGTQNFQRTYYKKNAPSFLPFPGNDQQVTEEISRFNVLAYEASMPIIYSKGKLMLIAIPSYILPQNLIAVSENSNAAEQGENMFYATLTAKYTF